MSIKYSICIAAIVLSGIGALVGASVALYTTSTHSTTAKTGENAVVKETIYTTFVINVHDWTQPENSIATLHHVLDLHDAYNVPIDIYLNDQITQVYATEAPDLIERLKTNPNVAISYHLRPPSPYYDEFHEEWFQDMSTDALYDELMRYETHAINLETGKPTDAPGGYQYVHDLIGYAPLVVAQAGGRSMLDQTLAKVYSDLGATFAMRHGKSSTLGDIANGLFLRPEHLELKVYERKDALDATTLIESAIASLPNARPSFLNLKWHENNFYTNGTPWNDVYMDLDDAPKDPPYDIEHAQTSTTLKTDAQQAIQWDRYEAMLIYVTTHSDTITPINAMNIATLLKR